MSDKRPQVSDPQDYYNKLKDILGQPKELEAIADDIEAMMDHGLDLHFTNGLDPRTLPSYR